MRTLCTRLLLLGLVLGLSPWVLAGEPAKPLSPQAETLQQRLAALQAQPHDRAVQTQYLEAFPKDLASFTRLFDPPDFSELYDGHDYIVALQEIAKDQPVVVGKLLIRLSKDAHKDADALTWLQVVTADYAATHTAQFVKLLRARSKAEIARLIRYLADVENHYAYPEYPVIIASLRKLGEGDLARQFEKAKRERMKRRDH